MFKTINKINFLLTSRQRKGVLVLIFLLIIGMILEIFGLGILMPILSSIIDPNLSSSDTFLSSIKESYFVNFSNEKFTFILLLFLLIIYFVKTIYLVFLTFVQNKYLSNLTAFISNKLYFIYLSQPFDFHKSKNSSDLVKNIQLEITHLHSYLSAFIIAVTEAFILISIVVTLIYIEPLGAISIGCFFAGISFIFFQFTKIKLEIWGSLREKLDKEILKSSHSSFNGIKDIILLNRQNYFIEKYSFNNFKKAKLQSNQSTFNQLPRFFLEFFSVLGLLGFIAFMLLRGEDTSRLITLLGVFVAATFKMIPSLNRLISSAQHFKYFNSSLNLVYDELSNLKSDALKTNKDDFEFKNKIVFKNANYSYLNKHILVASNIEISKGSTIGIIGPSGSGKSTFVDILVGLNTLDSGKILVDNIDIQENLFGWKNCIGYVNQSVFLSDDTIRRNICFGLPDSQIDDTRIESVLKQVQLFDIVNKMEMGINSIVGERGTQLSGGQIQRLGLARALYSDPEVLILDEATSSLDNETESKIMESIYKLKGFKTIIIVAHRLSTLKMCDFIYEINNGNITLNDKLK